MAETLFIADESDVRRSIEVVRSALPVVFLQQKRWDMQSPSPSADLSEYPELCRTGLTFFVLRSPEAVIMREIQGSDGKPLWEFDYRGTTGWIMVEAGGRREKGGDKRWVPGRIRVNLSDQSEKALYAEFKKHWLKGYKSGKENSSLARLRLCPWWMKSSPLGNAASSRFAAVSSALHVAELVGMAAGERLACWRSALARCHTWALQPTPHASAQSRFGCRLESSARLAKSGSCRRAPHRLRPVAAGARASQAASPALADSVVPPSPLRGYLSAVYLRCAPVRPPRVDRCWFCFAKNKRCLLLKVMAA